MSRGKQLEDALFFAALHISDVREREEFLDRACQDDPALRNTIEELLLAGQTGDHFVDRGYDAIAQSGEALRELQGEGDVQDLEVVDERIGTRIGPYTLLESLGKGGCGEVYLAEQTEPVKRHVALKVIKLGMDTRSVIRRFDAERQALAMMDHPNIARVLDAGATTRGRPYFVLELVRGMRITDYCHQHGCTLRQRVELVIQVCRAIQHAHQKGIIHRDIKPSNVLIAEQDGVPVPKVIDFGIAKAIEGRLTDETLHTQHEQLLGTPSYMSPEQAAIGDADIDTRSDIYSLGALLYELVTGSPPFDAEFRANRGAVEIRQMLLGREPKRPSVLLAEKRKASLPNGGVSASPDPAQTATKIGGELDWIIMRAMEKDRTRRYDTANGLALDLQRFLQDEPIAARPPGHLYVLRKLIRRNRVVFASGALILIVLTAGFGTSTVLYIKAKRAELRQAELRQTAEWALTKEAKLRRDAEVREQLTEAVALTRQDDFEAAALVLGRIDAPPRKPSLDAVTALRDVGQWLGAQQRWEEAGKCFEWLFEIDTLDPWQTVTLNCQAYGVLLVEMGAFERYNRFCLAVSSSDQEHHGGDEASRLLKSCLLRPLTPQLEESLEPLAVSSRHWFTTIPTGQSTGWPGIAPCLWLYRTGDNHGAIQIAKTAKSGSTASMAHRPTYDAILAMCYLRLDDIPTASLHLKSARTAVDAKFSTSLTEDAGNAGRWYDWLFARILTEEASDLIPAAEVTEDLSSPR